MAFLQAFIDDSAAQTGDRRLILAGYLHRAERWAEFSDDWHRELRAWPAIEYFKAVEANNLSGQFDHKKGWNEAKRNAKRANLAAIIEHYQPCSFEFSVNRQIFEDELKPVSPYGLGHPHFTMCWAVISGIARYAAQEQLSVPIHFIFDQQKGVDTDIWLFFSELKRSLPIEAQNLIGTPPSFEDDRDKRFMPLQAADLLAWHLRREHETNEPLSLTPKLVNRAGHLVQEMPDDYLRKWTREFRQMPGIPSVQSKGQWRNLKNEIKRLQNAGIDPSRIKGPGIYYPDNAPAWRHVIAAFRRLVTRR